MNNFYQKYWNKRIRETKNPIHLGGPTLERIARESGPFWIYQQDPHNNDAFRDGFEHTFGKRDDIGSNLAK